MFKGKKPINIIKILSISSKISLKSLQVGDEIVAVNLVDVTHMSLDDVVIIMSIPMRLILAIRHGIHQTIVTHNRQSETKAPPVVIIKKDLNEDETDHITSNHIR